MKGNRPNATKVDLDPKYYAKIDDLEKRFENGIPSLVECDVLTIKGDVLFKEDVKIKGTVTITNTRKAQAVIKEGTIIEKDLTF